MNTARFQRARKLWHLLTINPHRSYRELVPLLGVHSTCAVAQSMRILENLNYIKTTYEKSRSIIVLVPFSQKPGHEYRSDEPRLQSALLHADECYTDDVLCLYDRKRKH